MTDLSLFSTEAKFRDEASLLEELVAASGLDEGARAAISREAAELVRRIRDEGRPTMMEHFLAEYGLSTREGISLMTLAEALLRVPDDATADALITDKIAGSDWRGHAGASPSRAVNAATRALALTGGVLKAGPKSPVRRLGTPVIRRSMRRAMKEMGRQFVLGQTIGTALNNARAQEGKGYTYSYDMLGEAAMTRADAERYDRAYSSAIDSIAKACTKGSVTANPGISIKLSALHPRYEVAQEARVMAELVPVVLRLARQAKAGGMGLNIDAEEQDRLVLSLKVIEAVLSDPSLQGWDGFGVVVQAYGKRAGLVIDWLYALATRLDRRIMVRLVKGAYWDTEVKRAQVEGHAGFPLFTSKTGTDVSYIANARKLIGYADRIYPQFATHNAHTVAAIRGMVGTVPFEFQRLHGMGERLHDIVLTEGKGHCRIYAPVGAHRDLLAYLVRRLLENGANSSFVHQIVDVSVSPADVARDPFAALATAKAPATLVAPADLFGADRPNSSGFDLSDEATLAWLAGDRLTTLPDALPQTVTPPEGDWEDVLDPATGRAVAKVMMASADTVQRAVADARVWDAPAAARAETLRRAANLFEAHHARLLGILGYEAGKTLGDAVAELREAVDFLRYYAAEGEGRSDAPRGIITAISPWNFPLAIFSGQVAAALMAGNAVLAKPAEATPLIAAEAVKLLHEAGVPNTALQLLPGAGATVGAALTSDPRIKGVVFTGSTTTARSIAKVMAEHLVPGTPLIAETGGLNAMIVDATALPEQAVRDIVASSFRSAGQRCSALRCLYVQEDIAPHMIEMIRGAMDELRLGDPRQLDTDVGPVIDAKAQKAIRDYVAAHHNRRIHALNAPQEGFYVPPTLLKVNGIADLEHEVFGPVLHLATFRAGQLGQVINDINARGFGLTFGLHTRIETRAQEVAEAVHAGNLYINRNQIGAVVGSQPFGGEGLSGTGPKAGGPHYLTRFFAPATADAPGTWSKAEDAARLERQLAAFPSDKLSDHLLPGPTGELNRLSAHTRAPVLCLGPGAETAARQAEAVRALGGHAITAEGHVEPEHLARLNISSVLWWGDEASGHAYASALAAREGPILPLITDRPDFAHVAHERHLCVDTTAAGGNAALLAA